MNRKRYRDKSGWEINYIQMTVIIKYHSKCHASVIFKGRFKAVALFGSLEAIILFSRSILGWVCVYYIRLLKSNECLNFFTFLFKL